ncbi:MAG: prenyltransferase [Chloroflexi bacterium]|nr:prenyltransferase [Chloroflexota bacterium]
MQQALTIRQNVLSWLTLIRLGATARGILPFLLGAVIAWSQGYAINWVVLVLSSLAVACIMVMTFLVNEYYDYETDLANRSFHRLSGGSRVLPLGLVPRHHSIIAAYILLGVSGAIGFLLHFIYQTGPYTIPLGVLAIFIGFFYTARPFQWSYHGLGEIAIWLSCGWIATFTGYYLQVGSFDMVATLASLPGATSVFLVIIINEIPDIESDRLSGKRNLAVRLGKRGTAALYAALLILCWLNILLIVPFGVPAISAILSLVLVPLIAWNLWSLKTKGLDSRENQEAMSMRTMLFDHLITIIYAVTFVVAGLGLAGIRMDYLAMLAAAFIVVLGLEGLSIACSRMVVKG